MPVRRSTDPVCVQHVWDAIRSANYQRQVADYHRIVKYLQRVHQWTLPQAELYLNQSLEDGLIVAIQKTAYKGPKLGMQVESYKIPSQDSTRPKNDGKDWYCIECHLAGDVTTCQLCHRVFHNECLVRAKQIQNIFKSNNSNDMKETPSNDSHENEEIKATDTSNNDLNKNGRLNEDGDISNVNNNCENNEETAEVKDDDLNDYDEDLCSLCNVAKHDTNLDLEKEELNHLLSFILERIKSWLPDHITNRMAPEPKHDWLTEAELSWRSNQLFFEHMDMSTMGTKIINIKYNTLFEFQKDVLTIKHNVGIFHGTDSQEYGAAELMLNDCIHDLTELINCVDCYKHSNEKINNNWFCLPCRKPHKLVWAKQKGYPYWPAKVIKESETSFDVRFFGGKYERSLLPKNCIKAITVPQDTLNIKRSSAFNKAYEQLMLHQSLLENPGDVIKITSKKEKRKASIKPKKTSSVIRPNKRKSFDDSDIYEFHDSPNDDGIKPPKKKNTNSLPNKSFGKSNESSKIKRKSSSKSLDSGKSSSSVIQLSDDECSLKDSFSFSSYEGSEPVTSSTEECFHTKESSDTMQILEQPYSDAVEKMRRKLELTKDKTDLIKISMDCMQAEMDRQVNEHNEHIKKLLEVHSKQISETKKKQWCFYCEQDAIYHCCWNTAYCSQICQQQHWQAEHKKVCRRKR